MRNDLDCNSFLVLMETHYIQKKKEKKRKVVRVSLPFYYYLIVYFPYSSD